MQLLGVSELRNLTISNTGLLCGELRSNVGISSLQIQFDSSGSFFPDPSLKLVNSLVFVFLFLRDLSQDRLDQEMPTWLNSQFRLKILIQVERGQANEILPHLNLENLEQLQAYWALVDLATKNKSLLPAEKLA